MKWGLCLLFALGAAFLLGLVLFVLAGRRAPAYRAEAQIILQPHTNAVFTRAFEAQIVNAIPGVLRMEVVSTRLAIRITTPPYVKLGITNGAAIRIITVGSTAQQAHGTATNAAARLCVIVHDLYGSTAEVDDSTDRSRRYSVYYDGIQPNVIRSLKR